MKMLLKKRFLLISIGVALCLWQSPAEAARTFTVTNTSAAEFNMDGTVDHPITVRFQSTNAPGGTNSTDQIYQIVFQVSATYTSFPTTQPVQANGWTCTRNSSTQVTCATNRTAGPNRIPNSSPNYQDFTLNIRSVATTYDIIVGFSRVTATYYRTNGRTSTSANTATAARWTWKTLGITLTAVPASPGSGCTTTLTMHITKYSTTTPLTITPVLQAPSGSATATLVSGPSPATLPLSTAGPSGDIVWVYKITGSTGQSVTFTGCARSGGSNCTTASGSTRTSSTVSTSVTVAAGISCGLSAVISNSQICLYSGDTTTFTMTVTNTTGGTLNNVQPSALTPAVPPTVPTVVFGPFNPAVQTPISLPTGSSRMFTWAATVSGNPNDIYAVQGNATATGGYTTATVVSPSQDVDGYIAPPPDVTNTSSITADSTNLELDWNITNFACSNVRIVNIGIPAGWTFVDDGDALVTNMAHTPDDLWLRPAGSTTFTAQAPADYIPPGGYDGDFYLLFSHTPTTSGTYTFTVTIVDDAVPAVTRVKQTAVIVNPFDSSGPNSTDTGIWHEDLK